MDLILEQQRKIQQATFFLNYYNIVEQRVRIANSNVTYGGTVRMVGVGQTYTTLTAAYAAASNGDILQLIDGTYNLESEAGGYWLVNTSTKGVKVRGNLTDKTRVILKYNTGSFGIRLRDCGQMTFESLTISTNVNNRPIQQDNSYNSIYCKFKNCILENTNTGANSNIFSRSTGDSASVSNIWTEFENCTMTSQANPILDSGRGRNDTLLITGCTISSVLSQGIKYSSSNKGTIAIYDSSFSQPNNNHIIWLGEDNFTFTNTIKQVDLRNNTIAYSGASYGHAILFGAGTDKVYAVNNTVSQSATNNSLALGFVLKTMSTSIGNSYFAGNKITSPRPFYVKGGKNVIAKYNTFISNESNWYGLDCTNPAATALSSTNIIKNNNVIGNVAAIFCTSSGAWELPETTMQGWTIDNNYYFATSGKWLKKSDGSDHLFYERPVIWGNNNDANSRMLSRYKFATVIKSITDDTTVN